MAVFRVTVTGLLIGQTHENVLFFDKPQSDLNTPGQLAAEIAANWCVFWKTAFPTGNFTFTNINVANVSNPNDQPINLPVVITATGSANTSIIPFVAFKILKHTERAGRKGRGRMLISTPNAGNISSGVLTNATFTFLQNICIQCMLRYGNNGSSGFRIGLWSEGEGGGFIPITEMIPASTLASVRKRQLGQGV